MAGPGQFFSCLNSTVVKLTHTGNDKVSNCS